MLAPGGPDDTGWSRVTFTGFHAEQAIQREDSFSARHDALRDIDITSKSAFRKLSLHDESRIAHKDYAAKHDFSL